MKIMPEKQTKHSLKVLLVSPIPPPIGGIATWTQNIIDYLNYNPGKFDILICNSARKGRLINSKSIIKRVSVGILNSLKIYYKIKKNIKTNNPDLIHLVSSASYALLKDYLIVRLLKKSKIPFVLHWRFGRIPSLADKQNWEWKLLSKLIRKSNMSIVIDNESYKTLLKFGITNIVNIPNPISLDTELLAKDSLLIENKKQNRQLIFVGHVKRNKGVYELVQSCLSIQGDIDLKIIGPFEEKVKIELLELANRRENGNWLHILGPMKKEQVLNHMRNSSILVLPSYTEGFPNVVIEGMTMGCAIIATDVGAIPEMIDCTSNLPAGICVPVKDIKRLQIAIVDLINNPGQSENMGKRGKEKVLNSYTMEKVLLNYKEVWDKTFYN